MIPDKVRESVFHRSCIMSIIPNRLHKSSFAKSGGSNGGPGNGWKLAVPTLGSHALPRGGSGMTFQLTVSGAVAKHGFLRRNEIIYIVSRDSVG